MAWELFTKEPNLQSERSKRILELAQQGITLVDIGSQFNITRERVRQLLAVEGYRRSENRREVIHRAEADLLNRVSRYPLESARSLGKRFQMAERQVSAILRKHNVPRCQSAISGNAISIARRNGRIELTFDLLRESYIDLGMTQMQIALKYGYRQTTISARLRKYGLTQDSDKKSNPSTPHDGR